MKPESEEVNATHDYEDSINTTVALDFEDIQRVEKEPATIPPTTTTTTTTQPPFREASRSGKASEPNDVDDGFIKLKFSDPRELFYIPNDNNSLETVSPSFREFLIPKASDEVEMMQFKDQISSEEVDVVCPKYCDLRFLIPGTCHPCIMIK